LIVLLVVAKANWSGLGVFTAAVLAGTASMVGTAHRHHSYVEIGA
jgi:hypothetical protein